MPEPARSGLSLRGTSKWIPAPKLLEVLHGPNLVAVGLVESAGHHAVVRIGHVGVVAMGWKRPGAFVPHLLQAAGHDAVG